MKSKWLPFCSACLLIADWAAGNCGICSALWDFADERLMAHRLPFNGQKKQKRNTNQKGFTNDAAL